MNLKAAFGSIISNTVKFCKVKAPTLLTAGGLALGGATVYLVAKEAPEAKQRKEEALKKAQDNDMSKAATVLEVAKATVPVYAPAIVTGAGAATCLIMSNKISAERLATVTTAYGLLQKKFDDYKETAEEVLGEKKKKDLDRKAIEKQMEESKSDESKPIIPKIQDEGVKQLCYDVWSDRYFRASPDDLRKAENKLNLMLFANDEATLNDWYSEIGISTIQAAEHWGWTSKDCALKGGIDLDIGCCMSPNNTPCVSVDFGTLVPIWSRR